MALTTQDIHAAANKITEEGGTPTLSAVRKALNGGSFTTISDAMKEWKSSRATAPAPIREQIPQAVAARLNDVAGELWSVALDIANTRLQAEREALARSHDEIEQSRREAMEAADSAATELDQERANSAHKEATIDNQAGQVQRLTTELVTITDSAHTAQAALDEARARVKQLSGLLDQERAERAAATAAATQAETKAAVLAEKLKIVPDLKALAAELRTDLEAQTKARIVADQQVAVFVAQLDAAVKDAAELRSRLEAKAAKTAKATTPHT